MSAENNSENNTKQQPRHRDAGDASSDEELAQLSRGMAAEAQAAVVMLCDDGGA